MILSESRIWFHRGFGFRPGFNMSSEWDFGVLEISIILLGRKVLGFGFWRISRKFGNPIYGGSQFIYYWERIWYRRVVRGARPTRGFSLVTAGMNPAKLHPALAQQELTARQDVLNSNLEEEIM